MRGALFRAGTRGGDWRAAVAFLERRYPEDWALGADRERGIVRRAAEDAVEAGEEEALEVRSGPRVAETLEEDEPEGGARGAITGQTFPLT